MPKMAIRRVHIFVLVGYPIIIDIRCMKTSLEFTDKSFCVKRYISVEHRLFQFIVNYVKACFTHVNMVCFCKQNSKKRTMI